MDKIEREMDELAETLEKAVKTGEGSRGGKIIGHTKSGKPIYDIHGHPAHADFKGSDHGEAVQAHLSHISDLKAGKKGQTLHLFHEDDDSKRFSPAKREKIKSSRSAITDHLHSMHQAHISEATDPDLKEYHSDKYEEFKEHSHRKAALENMSPADAAKHAELKGKMKEAAEKRKGAFDTFMQTKFKGKKGGAEYEAAADAHSAAADEHGATDRALRAHERDVASRHPRDPRNVPASASGEGPSKWAEAAHSINAKSPEEHGAERNRHQGKVIDAMAEKHKDKGMKKGFESVLQTVLEMGPEALKKALPNLTEDQKALLSEVLAKGKEMSKVATPEGGPEVIQEASEKKKAPKKRHEEDEKLVDASITDVNPQGDDSEKDGQVIKSFDGIVARMKERKLAKADCVAAAQKAGNEDLAKAIESTWGEELEKAAPMAAAPAPTPAKVEKEMEAKAAAPKEPAEDEKEEAKKMAQLADKAGDKMQKSVAWTEGTQDLLKASTRRGQNCHYSVEDYLLKSEQEKAEILAKGGYLNETAKPTGKISACDILEKGLDLSQAQVDRVTGIRDAKPQGAFTVQSFGIGELAKSLGMSEEQAAQVLGVKPEDLQPKKAK